ncbi:DUF5753 domain-containing protein, partial [Streptomyces exfoliatus]
AQATYISTYQVQLIHGLLQTEEYARAVLTTGVSDDLDGLLAGRMERRLILEREQPPLAWAVLDEAVLHRPIGGQEVMRNQLAHLLEFSERRWMRIQVMPFSVGQHASLDGSFTA